MFDRLDLLIGDSQRKKLSEMTVLIVGVGGVGGYCVETLARSGIGNLILVDYDNIDISNINRQVIALNSNIGLKKIDVFEKRLKDINPNINIIKLDLFLDSSNINIIDNYNIDYLIDACDSLNTKKEIIKKCIENDIPFISSMGTGKRLNSSMLEITSLDKTNYDPIARILRKYVRDMKINKKIMVLSSREQPCNIDSKDIPSCVFVPSTAGILISNYVFLQLIK